MRIYLVYLATNPTAMQSTVCHSCFPPKVTFFLIRYHDPISIRAFHIHPTLSPLPPLSLFSKLYKCIPRTSLNNNSATGSVKVSSTLKLINLPILTLIALFRSSTILQMRSLISNSVW